MADLGVHANVTYDDLAVTAMHKRPTKCKIAALDENLVAVVLVE